MTINITNTSAMGFFKAGIDLFSVSFCSIMIVFTISIFHMAKIINSFENAAACAINGISVENEQLYVENLLNYYSSLSSFEFGHYANSLYNEQKGLPFA